MLQPSSVWSLLLPCCPSARGLDASCSLYGWNLRKTVFFCERSCVVLCTRSSVYGNPFPPFPFGFKTITIPSGRRRFLGNSKIPNIWMHFETPTTLTIPTGRRERLSIHSLRPESLRKAMTFPSVMLRNYVSPFHPAPLSQFPSLLATADTSCFPAQMDERAGTQSVMRGLPQTRVRRSSSHPPGKIAGEALHQRRDGVITSRTFVAIAHRSMA